MKRSLVAVSVAVLAAVVASAGCATAPKPAGQFNFDRMQPASPEQEFDGERQYARGCHYDNLIGIQPG